MTRNKNVHSVKLSPHKILTHCQRKNGKFAVDKSDRQPHIQVVKIHLTGNEMYECHVTLACCTEDGRTQRPFCGVCAQNAEAQSHHKKKHQAHPM